MSVAALSPAARRPANTVGHGIISTLLHFPKDSPKSTTNVPQ